MTEAGIFMTEAGIFWATLNTVLSVVLSAILVHKLISWFDNFNFAERVGMGLMAGSVLLTIPLMWATVYPTPFDHWSTSVLRIGAVTYFLGRLSRTYAHWFRNDQMRKDAEEHMRRHRR